MPWKSGADCIIAAEAAPVMLRDCLNALGEDKERLWKEYLDRNGKGKRQPRGRAGQPPSHSPNPAGKSCDLCCQGIAPSAGDAEDVEEDHEMITTQAGARNPVSA